MCGCAYEYMQCNAGVAIGDLYQIILVLDDDDDDTRNKSKGLLYLSRAPGYVPLLSDGTSLSCARKQIINTDSHATLMHTADTRPVRKPAGPNATT